MLASVFTLMDRARLALSIALWLGCAGSLSGCSSGLTNDGVGLAPERTAVAVGSLTAKDRMELSRASERYSALATPGNDGYRIGSQDVLDISVFKAPDLSKTVQVAESGSINLPLVGEVGAAGKTASGLERDLEAKLGAKYLKSPQVTIFIREYNSQRVTLEGAVKTPGVYPIRGQNTLLQSIATAGGLDREKSSNNAVVFRTINGVRTATRFDVDNILTGSAEDPQIKGGDVIVVDDSIIKSTFSTLLRVLPLATAISLAL